MAWLKMAFLSCLITLFPAQSWAASEATDVLLPSSVAEPPQGKGIAYDATGFDLAVSGYIEEEYFVSGKANVYEYDRDGAVAVKSTGNAYTTRILVRRPIDPKRFSGTVRFETMHPQYGLDFIWSRTTDFVIANGDALVSVSTRRGKSSGIEMMKRFDPVRYAPVSLPEDGLNWHIIAQIGRMLKSQATISPLSGFEVTRVTAQGWSGAGALWLIFISDGFHERFRMPDGTPIFDAYLVGEPSNYPRINSTVAAVSKSDPRQAVQAIDVPVISLHTRPQKPYRRRPDGDIPTDRYRVYEVAGAAHNNRRMPAINGDNLKELGRADCVFELSWFPLTHYFKSTLARLDAWDQRGVVPPPSQRIAINENGMPIVDAQGNHQGGVRSSYLDLPTARYFRNMPASDERRAVSCNNDGAQERFTSQKLKTLYGDQASYVKSVSRRLDQLIEDGWILAADAAELRKEAAQFGGF